MPKSDKPNILIIWGDDIGYWNISRYSMGHSLDITVKHADFPVYEIAKDWTGYERQQYTAEARDLAERRSAALRREARGSELLLIALTGWGQTEDKQRALQAGFDYHFTKPVEMQVIQKTIAAHERRE